MMIGRSRETTEQLDALLDGRLTEVPDELASLVAVADELRAELATIELDPAVAEQHLNRLYRRGRAGTRAARHQRVDSMWRRRVVSVGFAAILLLVPASFASGHALPGDPLYPLKRSIERVRLAAAMSPDADAQEKAHLADIRLEELQGLIQAGDFGEVPQALVALQQAVLQAQQALIDARARGADSTEIAALETRLAGLEQRKAEAIESALKGMPEPTRNSIIDVINRTPPKGSASKTTRAPGQVTTTVADPGGSPRPGPTTTTICIPDRQNRCVDGLPGGGGETTTTVAGTTTTTLDDTTTTTEDPTTTTQAPTTTGADDESSESTNLVGSILETILP
jgi:hypothetical protein